MIALLKRGAVLGQTLVDKANPLLVRHVRQELRNRGFIGIFMLLLLAAVLASLFMAGTAVERSEGEAGRWLFGLLGGCLTFALWVAQPIGAFRAMMRERDDDTWDLIDLTGMRPGGILRGILQATLVQGALYTAAIAPFMLMAYLLRGLDILTVALTTLWLILIGVLLTAFAIFWGCLGPNKATRAVLFVLLILMLMVGWLVGWIPLAGLTAGHLDWFEMNDVESWVALGFWLNAWVAALVLLLVLSATLLTFRAGNRSTTLRVTWLAITVNGMIWALATGPMAFGSNWVSDMLLAIGIGLTVLAIPMGMFAGTEDHALSPRQLRWLRRDALVPFLFGWFLGPGEARGTLCFLLMAVAAVPFLLVAVMINDREVEAMRVCLVLLGHCCFYLALTQLLARGWFAAVLDTPASKRVMFLALMIAASVLQLMVNLVVDDGFPPLNVLSPPWSAVFAAGEIRMGSLEQGINAVGMVLLSAAGVAMLLISMARSMGTTEVARVHARDDDRNPRGG